MPGQLLDLFQYRLGDFPLGESLQARGFFVSVDDVNGGDVRPECRRGVQNDEIEILPSEFVEGPPSR